ncbi:MAG: marine proteobacterial sortase target protein [Woeseia sp.]
MHSERSKSWRRGGWVSLLAIVGMTLAAASEVPAFHPADAQSGTLIMATPFGNRPATRLNTDIDIQASGMIARTFIRQTFRNDGPHRVEGIYVFPLPDGAAVDRMRMHIGERVIEGEIREKEQAKKEYTEAREAGKRTSLVEQQRANLFTTSIANLEPGATVVVEIGYLETIAFADGLFSLRIPLTLTPRYIPGTPQEGRKGSGWSADTDRVPDASLITPPATTPSSDQFSSDQFSSDYRVTLQADIEAGVPLQLIGSRYHPVTVMEIDAARGHHRVVLADSDVPMDHDIELNWRVKPESIAQAALFSETRDGMAHYLLMMLPPADELQQEGPTIERDLVFVIDTSGSMHGTSIEQARKALLRGLDGLQPGDRFNVVQFNSVTSALFPDSVNASVKNVERARDYVRRLVANGGTEMRPALEQVLRAADSETHLRQIVFITDGSVGNEAELIELIGAQLDSARLFTVGIGSAPNGLFMRKAAAAGRGSFTFISALHEVEERMQQLVRKLERPQVTGIQVEWSGTTDVIALPEIVPDLYTGEPVLVRARLPGAPRAGDQLTVSGNSPTGRWQVTLPLATHREHAGVASVWARGRIEQLLDGAPSGEDNEAIRAAVIETALAHHLVSQYTSLVAVDKTPLPPAKRIREQVPNLLPYGQSTQAIFGLPATATAQQLHYAVAVAALIVALFLACFKRLRGYMSIQRSLSCARRFC